MRVNKQISILRILFFVVVILMTCNLTVFAGGAPKEVCEAAEKGLQSFLKAIPVEELEHFSFSNQIEVDQAVLA